MSDSIGQVAAVNHSLSESVVKDGDSSVEQSQSGTNKIKYDKLLFQKKT